MKNIKYLFIGIIVLLGLFYVLNAYIYNEKQGEDKPVVASVETASFFGVVTSVDLNQMTFDGPGLVTFVTDANETHTTAVASMGRNLCTAKDKIADVYTVEVGDSVKVGGEKAEDGRIVPCMGSGDYLVVTSLYKNNDLGFSFEYEKSPKGYIAQEILSINNPLFAGGVVLTGRSEYEEIKQSLDAREGPPTISVEVYKNTEILSPALWVTKHPKESNSGMMLGATTETTVGGANAVQYTADGLYATNTYVIAHANYMFVLRGAYLDQATSMYIDFQNIVDSFKFLQPTSPSQL